MKTNNSDYFKQFNLKNYHMMKWKNFLSLVTALSLFNLSVFSQSPRDLPDKTTIRISNEKLDTYLEKVLDGKASEAYSDLKADNPFQEDVADHLRFLRKNLTRLSETARLGGNKAQAYAFVRHGVSQLDSWMNENASGISTEERINAYAMLGKVYERNVKDSQEAARCYEAAIKLLAPRDWKFESVEKLEELKETVSDGDNSISLEAKFAFDRLISLKRQQQIISTRIAAAAKIRNRRAQASNE